METWTWIVVVFALVLLLAGTLRFDLLLPALRERLGGAAKERPARGAGAGAAHAHGAAAHTGHVAPHGHVKRRLAFHRSGRRH